MRPNFKYGQRRGVVNTSQGEFGICRVPLQSKLTCCKGSQNHFTNLPCLQRCTQAVRMQVNLSGGIAGDAPTQLVIFVDCDQALFRRQDAVVDVDVHDFFYGLLCECKRRPAHQQYLYHAQAPNFAAQFKAPPRLIKAVHCLFDCCFPVGNGMRRTSQFKNVHTGIGPINNIDVSPVINFNIVGLNGPF